jgi:hypothetical protein
MNAHSKQAVEISAVGDMANRVGQVDWTTVA